MTIPPPPTFQAQTFQSLDEIEHWFQQVAHKLFFEYKLEAFGETWRITAVELYLFIPHHFEDPFTHRFDEQLKADTFYLHYDGKRAPNYSGIDITCGNCELGIYGGIQIRELDFRDGSATSLKTIVRGEQGRKRLKMGSDEWRQSLKWTDAEKERLQLIHRSHIFEGAVKLVPHKTTPSPITAHKRVGLKVGNSSSEEERKQREFFSQLKFRLKVKK